MPKRSVHAEAYGEGQPKPAKQKQIRKSQPDRLPPDPRTALGRRLADSDSDDDNPTRSKAARDGRSRWGTKKEKEKSAWDVTRTQRTARYEAAAPAAADVQRRARGDAALRLQQAVDSCTEQLLAEHKESCSMAADSMRQRGQQHIVCYTGDGPVSLLAQLHRCACGKELQAEAYDAGCVPTSPVRASTWICMSLWHTFKFLHHARGVSADGEHGKALESMLVRYGGLSQVAAVKCPCKI